MTIVNIDDYRLRQNGGPCEVTFIGPTFKLPNGSESHLSATITIGNGDFSAAIHAVKDQGGVYIPSIDDEKTFWFLPWPCAAVRVRAVPKAPA